MGKDIWIPNQQAIGPKLRIRITYNYSEIQKFTSLEQQWKEFLLQDADEYMVARDSLQDIRKAFDFITRKLTGNKTSGSKEEEAVH